MREIGIPDLSAYRAYLTSHPDEWRTLSALCRVTISRFYRDQEVWDHLCAELLPATMSRAADRGDRVMRAWSAGCASGEEPYTLALVWKFSFASRYPELSLAILATDIDDAVLSRARRGCYEANSLTELPEAWREAAFRSEDSLYCLSAEVRSYVELGHADLQKDLPDGPFHVILCRNLAFTYFGEPLQRRIAAKLAERLLPGGLLIIGLHEHLPDGVLGLTPCDDRPWALRRAE